MCMNNTITSYKGVVVNRRSHGGVVFMDVFRGADTIEVVARKDHCNGGQFELCRRIRAEDYVAFQCACVDGSILVLHVLEHRSPQDNPGLTLHHQRRAAVNLSRLLRAVRGHLSDKDYVEVRLPSVHYGQGKGHTFALDFFGKPARLTSSNALFLAAAASRLVRCYSLQRVFRAEPSRTSRHLSEFDMLEVGLLGSRLDDCMAELESLLAGLVKELNQAVRGSSDSLLCDAVQVPFRRVAYKDIERAYGLNGKGLGKHEREIAADGPVFVVDLPADIASWAARHDVGNDGVSRSFNLLLPTVGEVAEGSERNTNTSELRQNFKKWHLEGQLGWYANDIRYSDSLLSVYGLGVERLAMWLFGYTNIRQGVIYYRDEGFSEYERNQSD